MKILMLLLGFLSPLLTADSSARDTAVNTQAPGVNPPAAAAVRMAEEENEPFTRSFQSMAGVSLYSSKEELTERKGQPLAIVPDPWQNSLEYRYADMSAGVLDGVVVYVHVSPEQARDYGLKLNGVEIDPVHDTLPETLGSPDFVAEDGDVYLRGTTALKIYVNRETGEWSGIDMFDDISS